MNVGTEGVKDSITGREGVLKSSCTHGDVKARNGIGEEGEKLHV